MRAFLLVNTNFFFTAVRVRATSRPKRKRRKTSARGLYVLFGRTVLVWTIRSRTAAVFFFPVLAAPTDDRSPGRGIFRVNASLLWRYDSGQSGAHFFFATPS